MCALEHGEALCAGGASPHPSGVRSLRPSARRDRVVGSLLAILLATAGCEGQVDYVEVEGGSGALRPGAEVRGSTPVAGEVTAPAAETVRPIQFPIPPPAAVFGTNVVHRIELTVASEHLNKLDNDTVNRVPCTFTFDGVTLQNVGIRKKGGLGSPRPLFDKTGFSVKFNEFVSGQKLHGLRRLALNNAIQDPTFVSEHIGYEVYRRAGIPAPHTSHAVVTFNGQVFGLYVVKEVINSDFMARHFSSQLDNGNIYEGPAFVDFVDEPDKLELKDEVEDLRKRDDLRALATLVQAPADAGWERSVRAKLDLDQFITTYALDRLLDHWDGYAQLPNNYFMYHHPGTDKFIFMPHGMDQLLQLRQPDPLSGAQGRLAQRVRSIASLDAKYQAELGRLLRTAWDVPALQARIDQVKAVLAAYPNPTGRALTDIQSFNDNSPQLRARVAERKADLLTKFP